MAVQAQPYGGGNTALDLFSRSCWTAGDNCWFEQAGYVLPHKTLDPRYEFSESLDCNQILINHMEKQKQELDDIIRSENERLRTVLQEQRKHQVVNLLHRLEFQASVMLRQKDEALRQVSSRTTELMTTLKRLESENAMWQKMAKDKEAVAVALNTKLQELQVMRNENLAEDEESCCGDIGEQEEAVKVVCRNCEAREACVLFLPCRHLCCCRSCGSYLPACPVCRTSKKAIIETMTFS